jgi:uncharacterized protein (TIGR03435 family)
MSRPLLLATLLVLTLPFGAYAQIGGGDDTLRFEVASIRANTSTGVPPKVDIVAGRFSASNVTLLELIKMAYPIGDRVRGDNLVAGGPRWIGTDRFDVVATGAPATVGRPAAGAVAPPESAALTQVRTMLRNLLTERFMLAVRTEARQLPIFTLVRQSADTLGRQLRPMTGDCASESGPRPQDAPACGGFRLGAGRLAAHGVTMSMFVSVLAALPAIGRPIEDGTRLTGTFDLELTWTPEPPLSAASGVAAANAPSIFTAVQEQLGLTLRAGRGPVEVLVIDSADAPTPN